MNPTIESTRFGQYCINVYLLSGGCFLVCGRQGTAETYFTQAVFRDCRRPLGSLIHTLQQHLQRLEESNDFQDWFQLVYGTPWDPNDSRCPLCFVACRQVADELRGLMGADYGRFLQTTLQITVCHLPPEANGHSSEFPSLGAGQIDDHHFAC